MSWRVLNIGESAQTGDQVMDLHDQYQAWTPICDGPVLVTQRRHDLGYRYRTWMTTSQRPQNDHRRP